jgi:hypothetical protein
MFHLKPHPEPHLYLIQTYPGRRESASECSQAETRERSLLGGTSLSTLKLVDDCPTQLARSKLQILMIAEGNRKPQEFERDHYAVEKALQST